jgi:serine/threonine protein kinase
MIEEELFHRALEKPTLAEQLAFLDEVCADQPELRQRVERLLRSHRHEDSFLHSSVTIDQPATEAAGTVIGPYKLLEQLGEGGMGTVFLAEQTQPVQRKVALKLIKSGMDSQQVIARFEAERQALALMDHPNIAKVHDGGTTADGRPYFVMELVKGVPITRYCDERHLTPPERLELFLPVCQAVQHAHQKGIIHRDLKPSNVLVCLYDGKPVPKVIDFGIAKAAGPKLTEKTLFTEIGQVVGTLEYMSPEQAELNQLDIDTRSDIYSLGVLLYELLTGSTPLERKRFKEVALLEVLRLIREEESPRPSTRLSTTEGLPAIAANRGLEPKKLSGLVRGELDWIVLKALEKDRNRRYDTANAFALDVQRYLAEEPVQACPPSAWYRFRKFVQRNKGPVLAASLVLLALVGGIIGTTLGLLQARVSEEKARNEAMKAVGERDRAAAARDWAADTLDAMTSSVVGDALTQQKVITPEQKKFLTTALEYYRELLKEKARDEGARKRLAEAAYRVGFIEFRLGRKKEGADLFRRARDLYVKLATEFPTVPAYRFSLARGHNGLGVLLYDLGKWDLAEIEHRAGLDIHQKLVAEFPAVAAYREDLATSHNNLGLVLKAVGKRDRAESEYRAAIDLRKKLAAEFPSFREYRQGLADSHNSLGNLLADFGKQGQAETEYRLAIDLRQQLAVRFPAVPDYRDELARSHNCLGSLLRGLGKWDQAETEYRAARNMLNKLVVESPAVADYRHGLALSHYNLGSLLQQDLGKWDQAETEYRAAIAIYKKLTAEFPADPKYRLELAATLNNRVHLLDKVGKREQVETECRAAIAIFQQLVAEFPAIPDHAIGFGGALCNLGLVVRDRGRPNDALAWFDQAITTLSPVVQKEVRLVTARQFLRNSYWGRAETLDQLQRHDEAAKDWASALNLSAPNEKTGLQRGLMLSRVHAGHVEAALKDADQLATSDCKDLLYGCTCVYALAHARTKDDKHAARAVELLRQAAAIGYRDVGHIKQDTDLDSLRNRDDFRQLIAELEKRSGP